MFRGDKVSVLQDEEVLEMDGVDGCTTVQRYLMPRNCTLENETVSLMLCVFYYNF